MGLLFSSRTDIISDPHYGGNDLSKSSSKVSSATVPSAPRTNGKILQSPNLESFGFSELKEATTNFGPDAVLEEGDFGSVYKGWIHERSLKPVRPETGMAIAVKMLNPKGCHGRQELLAEIKYMGQLYHPNLVKLIGYCLEDDHRLLVYEFMPNGSLKNYLFGTGDSHFSPLSWNLRMKVALGAAKCLAFLHCEADVIYRDFKTSNILLDSNYNAKLSDLGLAKDGPIGCKSHVSTRVLGTEGYAAPEYIRTGKGRNDASKSSSKVSPAIMPSTPQTSSEILQLPDLKSFCFSELKEATGYFSINNELGKDAFGCVFKGWINEHSLTAATPKTGMTVAAKMLYQTGCQTKQEWLEEIEFLGRLCHPNLVKLIGFCLGDNHRLLIYEFMPNANLANHLFGYGAYHKPFSWDLCMKAALDAAKGLAFLHDNGGVIYGDFKTSNILLDSKCNAKLCDFGLAKGGLRDGKSHAGFLGTAGYVAPEYINTGHVTAKSNVYSFGVILLEMVFGQQAISICMENQFKEQVVVKWASKIGRSGPKIGELALQCISREPECRPNMKDVVQVLEEVSELHRERET